MKNKLVASAFAAVLAALPAASAHSHCQIPCGIYGDRMRFEMLAEHYATIEKSMRTIDELSKARKPDYNQLVRWVGSKDEHADEVAHIVTYYFMAQRVKLPEGKKDEAAYRKKLELLHGILVHAMKAKQGTDLEHVKKLRELTDEFREAYFGPEGKYLHKH